MIKRLFLLVLLSLVFGDIQSQDDEKVTGFFFGPKIGPTIGFQNWNGAQRNPMFNFHSALFIETIDPDFKGALFAQVGLHSRGSGLRVINNISNINLNQAFVFRNASVMVGAKKRLLTKTLKTPYYFVGLRLEYQLSNNLASVQERYFGSAASLFYPLPEFVRDWTYGLTFGGGIEFLGSELIQPAIELSISPDLNFQYESQAIPNIINPFNGQPTSLPERKIRNVSMEISLVIRFMRRVVLID